MKIIVVTIPHDFQRYPTFGDWQWHNEYDPTDLTGPGQDVLTVRISELEDERDMFLGALHEIIEAFLCRRRGISGEIVDKWDMEHLDAEEPGELPDAPYHREHVFAENIEKLVAYVLDRNWANYGDAVATLFVKQP